MSNKINIKGNNSVNGIYLHIPFCSKKCEYCDFCTYINMDKEYEKYTEYLIKELKMYPKYLYNTVYFGGGTPSLLPVELIKKIYNELYVDRGAEITLELNPEDMKKEKLREIREIGINRLSIGIQSFQDEILKFIGRNHSGRDAIRTFRDAREVGFDNITIDLMFGIPNQTLENLKEDLKIIEKLKPDNISIYSLIWEEGTIFWGKLKRGLLKQMDEDLEAEMYELIIDTLEKMGYEHYEISNFSRGNKRGKHNLKYWKNKEFIGIGMGASSYYKNRRYSNVRTFKKYYDFIDQGKLPTNVQDIEIIDEEEKIKLKKMLGLRLIKDGIEYFEDDISKKLLEGGLLEIFINECGEKQFRLSRKGIFLANDVFVEFV